MAGKLFIVGTPIGNLGDITLRALETLKNVDFIAAEDTRVTLKLLNRFEISKPLVSYYEHNRIEAGEKILSRLLAEENCALVSDAGMPAISDPGRELVALCAEAGIEAVVIPGASAVVSAVALSGLDAARFAFEGFLSTAKKSRRERLTEIATERRALVFYEAPHKLSATLTDLAAALGGGRKIAICRELTKLHEEVIRTTLAEAAVMYKNRSDIKGEFALVIEGAPETEKVSFTLEEAVAFAKSLLSEGVPPSEAAKRAAADCGFSRGEIYRELVK